MCSGVFLHPTKTRDRKNCLEWLMIVLPCHVERTLSVAEREVETSQKRSFDFAQDDLGLSLCKILGIKQKKAYRLVRFPHKYVLLKLYNTYCIVKSICLLCSEQFLHPDTQLFYVDNYRLASEYHSSVFICNIYDKCVIAFFKVIKYAIRTVCSTHNLSS